MPRMSWTARLICTDPRDVIRDAVLVAGTTRRRGRNRKYFTLFPEQLGRRIASMGKGTVAVLFGNEETGLTDDELALCHVAVTIPASPDFPSLNLSHAVQVICYEIFRAQSADHLTPFSPISAQAVDELVSVITGSLSKIGFFTIVGPGADGRIFQGHPGPGGSLRERGKAAGGDLSQDRGTRDKEAPVAALIAEGN